MIEVHYIDLPSADQETPKVTGRSYHTLSQPELLLEQRQELLLATPELRGWPLDGTRKLLDDETRVPFWSGVTSGRASGYLGAGTLRKLTLDSNSTALDALTRLELNFSEPRSISNLTFVFAPGEGHWCSKMKVALSLRGDIFWEQIVRPTGPRWVLNCTSESFDHLEIWLMETDQPGCYGKLNQLFLGQVLVFSREELKKVELINEADPSLDELTVDTMTVEVRDTQKRNLAPRKDQRIELYRDGKLLASHIIESCSRQEENHYTFTCRSIIGQLEDTFLGGMYDRVPLKTLLDQILQEIPYEVDEAFADATITGYLPVCTRRQALQQVAFTVGGLVSTWGIQGLRLRTISEDTTGSFRSDAVFRGGTVETISGVSRIEVVAHQYTPVSERQTLIAGENLNGREILLTFQEPHHSYEITGGTLLQQGVNHIVIAASGEVTVTAGTYRHSTVRHSRICSQLAGVRRDQIRKVENVSLVHSKNVGKLLDRLSRIYSQQHKLTQAVVVDGQYAGQRISAEDPWGNPMEGCITQMHSSLTAAGHTADITVLGMRKAPEIAIGYAGGFYAGRLEVGL